MMKISLICVPYDLEKYGAGMGAAPEAMLASGLVEQFEAQGIEVVAQDEAPKDLGEGDGLMRIARLGRAIAEMTSAAIARDSLPVILGGGCLVSLGVNAGLQRAHADKKMGIAWFDAHGDFNTPEISHSGYYGGMPLAATCGFGLEELRTEIGLASPIDPNYVIMLGVRDLDHKEKVLLDSTPISYLSPAEVANGRASVAAGYHFQDVDGVYLHLDIDALDLAEAPGVTYPSPGGISSVQVIEAAKTVQETAPLVALSLTAIDVAQDVEGQTVSLGIKLLTEILSG
jgi:arginase